MSDLKSNHENFTLFVHQQADVMTVAKYASPTSAVILFDNGIVPEVVDVIVRGGRGDEDGRRLIKQAFEKFNRRVTHAAEDASMEISNYHRVEGNASNIAIFQATLKEGGLVFTYQLNFT